eukprot:COSAG02_NODE_47012_length_344_cov_0.840816_2_plen_27_part_01
MAVVAGDQVEHEVESPNDGTTPRARPG